MTTATAPSGQETRQKSNVKLSPEEQTRADIETGVDAFKSLESMVAIRCPQLLVAALPEIEEYFRGQCKTLGISWDPAKKRTR